MPHEVKMGDRFMLLNEEWVVIGLNPDWFKSKSRGVREINLHKKEVDLLDWLEPKLTIPKKTKEELMKWTKDYAGICHEGDLEVKLNSFEETE